MAIDTEQLLALKAFYMGHGIAENRTMKSAAISMIDAAINHFRDRRTPEDRLRLAFYHLLKAEVIRHEGSPIQERLEAQKISEEIGSALYRHFMAIEAATQSTKKLDGIQNLAIVDEGVKRTKVDRFTTFWGGSFEVRHDIAQQALGISNKALTKNQKRFLEVITLKDMLERHGVPYAP